jgi:hypothetical protein
MNNKPQTLNAMNYTPTAARLISENYPYGYTAKTTKTDWLEFSPKKGFRHCSQTINPKTGRPNAPKKSVYYDILLMYRDESGHVKTQARDIRDLKEINQTAEFLARPEIFALFTAQEIEYIYINMIFHSKVSAKAQVIYCGSDWDKMKPYFAEPLKELTQAANTKGTENRFNKIRFDIEAINALKVPNYNPFTVKTYESRIVNDRLTLVQVPNQQ